jgi:general secretion pathway protein D
VIASTGGLRRFALVVVVAVLAAGCASSRAFRQGNDAMKAGDLDQAVAFYRTAANASPDNANYKIALERAMLAASREHFERARQFEEKDQLEAARGEYRLAAEYDPSNRQAAAKVTSIDQTIRQRIEAARPRPEIETLRERARAASAPPVLNPGSRELLVFNFRQANLRDILDAIGANAGINVSYDTGAPVDRPVTINLEGVTLEQALQQLMTMNGLSYKVLNDKSIFVFQDTQAKHAQFDDQVIQTFYLAHADVNDMSQLLSSIIRLPQLGVPPIIQVNKSGNTIVVRGSTQIVQIIEKIIEQNDKPRAEIVIDVEILEVNRQRAKQYGLELTNYAIGAVLSPEVSPAGNLTVVPPPGNGNPPTTPSTGGGQSTPPTAVVSPPPFNANTISQGFSASDFYLAVPAAIIRFLETDTNSKLIAKPQLRGAEGTKLSLRLGDRVPVIQTSYTPLATGGAGVNPLSSYTYQDVGVNIDMTPTVTVDGDIVMDLTLDNSSLGPSISVAGVSVPSFGQRTVTTRLRLRDGESNLLAGLLREDERKSLRGFPGAIHVPILSQLFSSNDSQISQTDIVMLLTPHIIRTRGITEQDLRPIYIGSAQNLGLGGPPPLIGGAPDQPAPAQPAPGGAAAPPGAIPAPGGGLVAPPPGSTPVPGTVPVQPAPPVAPPPPPAAAAPPPAPATAPPGPEPVSTPGLGSAQVFMTPPGTTFRVGQGPYTMPISIGNVSRLSTISLTVTFDPALLRVRSVQEGSFMRSAGANATFTQQINPSGRVDITITRASDATGASGTGLLAAILFDAIAPGSATVTMSGVGTGPGGTAMGLTFRPVTVSIQP